MNETPWGGWEVLHSEPGGMFPMRTVKRLTVNPGCMTSLQTHKNRTEYWQPLSVGLVAYLYEPSQYGPEMIVGDTRQAVLLEPYKTFMVPSRWAHRLINAGSVPVSLIETLVGKYDEDDIVRIHDAYGRT